MFDLKKVVLEYYLKLCFGKISVELIKLIEIVWDFFLVYSFGVVEFVCEIVKDLENVYFYMNKGNLVVVISDGLVILGLGNLGGLVSKFVMEGKGVLFKCFVGIDVFDIEVDVENLQVFIDIVNCIFFIFGGINLEDIKVLECFEIEWVLVVQCNILVFYDD